MAGNVAGGVVGEASLPALRQASAQAERVFASTRALYDEAAEIRRKVRYQLRRNLAALQRLGDTALGAAEEHGELLHSLSSNTAVYLLINIYLLYTINKILMN